MNLGAAPPPAGRPRPPQFHLSTLMGVTAAVAVLFGTLRWLGVPDEAAYLVLGLLVVCGLAAGGLVLSLRSSLMDFHQDDSHSDEPPNTAPADRPNSTLSDADENGF